MGNKNSEKQVRQVLHYGKIIHERMSAGDTMFANAGRRLYVIGDIDGRFRPRSNPYDLYAFGHPDPNDPLANKLQGVWAQPVKGFNGYGYRLEVDEQTVELDRAVSFTQTFITAEFEYQKGSLKLARQDFVAVDLPVLFSTLKIENSGNKPVSVRVVFWAEFDLQDAWFTTLADRRNAGQQITIGESGFIARAEVRPDAWSAAMLGERSADDTRLVGESTGELAYDLHLAAGETVVLNFGMAVIYQCGNPGELGKQELARREEFLAEKAAWFEVVHQAGPRLVSPDPSWNEAFELAQANYLMLEAEQPGLGRYYYAGLEMFPFWFGGDGAYSLVGLLVGGRVQEGLNHIDIGRRYQQEGRIPHQVSPSGRLAFPGSAQETPLWVTAVWDAYRWTGDREFLARLYPAARKGLLDYTLGAIDPDGDGYASGPGAVEREDMGEEKLDTAAHTWAALNSLAQMAEVVQDSATARIAREWAEKIEARFDIDWWDPDGEIYSMSLDEHNRRYPVPHWAVIVPLEVGLATPEHAAATLRTIQRDYLNAWGLKHTAGEDERVWTLPTATLSRAAFRYGRADLGVKMLDCVVKTLQHGPVGVFHELIPEGACFVQLWSAATFLRGVVEDLLGITVDAGAHRLAVEPRLPEDWSEVRIENLAFGEHVVNIEVQPGGGVRVTHASGVHALVINHRGGVYTLQPGESCSA